jgi:hypothetical protein
MYFQFYLDDLEIDEPQGFADIVLNMKRDDNWHGIFFEASTSELAFYGAAAGYLKDKKKNVGLMSDVTFKALQACGIYDELETIFEGKLDFGKYTESCGNSCLVKIPVEQTGCLMTLRNRYDQKVDMDSTMALDKITPISVYAQLGQTIPMPAIELDARVEGYVAEEGNRWPLAPGWSTSCDEPAGGSKKMYVRPEYQDERFNSIATGQLTGGTDCESADQVAGPMTPQFLYEQTENGACFNDDFILEARLKGDYFAIPYLSGTLNLLQAEVILWNGESVNFDADSITLDPQVIVGSPTSMPAYGNFDISFNLTIPAADIIANPALYVVLHFETTTTTDGNPQNDFTCGANFDTDTFFKLYTKKKCPDTTVKYYMVHEAVSRVTESITSNCIQLKSDYYGRIDSQPYSAVQDGCGSLRFVTSGLKIRKAKNPAFFASLKDLFEGLRGIDNIGMGIEDNVNIPGHSFLRIESVDYFYQDIEILALPFVPEPEISIQDQLHYSLIKSGYQKWEVEKINGLEEPNSNREYRTGLSSINNTIDITSKLIAGSYPIEVTRQQSFAKTGAADTTYDNETFIICVERQAYNFKIEQNNIDNPTNIFSPQTIYNWRIRPYSNLMRWFKSIVNSYPSIYGSSNKLFFSSGTGNFLAQGQLLSAFCKLENGVKAENMDLGVLDFVNQLDATPLWKPEYADFKYPLSIADYKKIKSTPYGYISFQCGTGEWKKGYVQNLRYHLNKGEADFTLKIKYN